MTAPGHGKLYDRFGAMSDPRYIDQPDTERVAETLLERPVEALVNEATQARKRTVRLREDAKRLKAAAVDAKKTSRRRVSEPETEEALRGGFVHVLYEDPELAETLSPNDARVLKEALRAPVITIREGSWHPPHYDPDRTYGLLILEGLLGRRVMLGAATTIELLGHGDIVRPWQKLPESLIPARVQWRALSNLRAAVLDERVTVLIGRRPELTVAFAARLARQSHAATRLAAIGHIARVEDRLLAILCHLAGNWGRVTTDGVRIPFRLTHEVLGELVGAKRPSVTIGLSYLRQQGEVVQAQDGRYILTGSPPNWQPEA